MNKDKRLLQQLASVLRDKASQFEANREISKRQVADEAQALRDLINTVEADLIRKIDRLFENNAFAAASTELEDYSESAFIDCNKLERVSREPVPPVTGPSEDDYQEVQKVILELINFERRTREAPLRTTGRAISFDEIELSWSSVIGAVSYQVEGRRLSDSAFSKIYEGNSLKHTATGLEPGTKYLFHLRSVFGDGTVSEWSREIEVITQEVPVPCNITANIISCDTVSVSWSPVPAEGAFYRVCIVEATENGVKSCVVDCGQNTRHKLIGSSTKYSFSVQAGRGNAWSNWSSTVSVSVPKWKECVWKECPDDVDKWYKYYLDYNNPRTVTKANDGMKRCTVIGNTALPQNKVTSWNIKILKSKNNDGDGMHIGVAPFDINQSEGANYNKCGWYFSCYYSALFSGPSHNCNNKKYGPKENVHAGDNVDVVMDTTKGELSFSVNNVDYSVAFDGISLDKPLVPCVLLYWKDDSVELII